MTDKLLIEDFTRPELDRRLHWYCEPARWGLADGHLWIEPDAKTDYWQRTHYGFQVDNGPFLYLPVEQNFSLSARVRFFPRHQYDQVGLMVRITADTWIKTSVEYEPAEPAKLGAVVTNFGYSDWSTQEYIGETNELDLRINRRGDDYQVEHRQGAGWVLMRMAHLHNPNQMPVLCGIYACSPINAGFRAEVDFLRVVFG